MPGIYEVQSETASEGSPSNEVDASAQNAESEQPARVSDQTDKINNFLLKSFLQHINNHPINMASEPVQRDSEESDGDWS